MFPGERLVLPAGTFKVRSYDTDYRFRPDTAHTYFSGNQTVRRRARHRGRRGRAVRPAELEPRHRRVLPRPACTASCGSAADRRCKEISDSLGLEVRHIDELAPALGGTGKTRVHRGVSSLVDAHGRRRRRARRRLRPGRLRDAADQGRLGGRRAADRLRHHDPGLRGQRRRVEPRPGVRRALDRGHLLPPRPRDGQRHRLRLDRRRRLARHHAALDREHRPDHARRARAARHGRRGPQPLHRRRHAHPARRRHLHAAAARPLRRSSTTRRRPASPR